MIDMENWKPVVGYEGLYEVSDQGRVRSVDRITRDGRRWKGRVLSTNKVSTGYLRAVLSVDGKYNHVYVHRLVADAFVPNPQGKLEVNHKDGNKKNNVASNLEWVTHSENGLHAFRVLGRTAAKSMLGKPSPNRKLTDEQAEMIRTSERSCYSLAREFGVSDSVVQDIRNGKRYKVKKVTA